MRIAIIVDTFPSLSETFISNKVIGLSESGHELTVFCHRSNQKVFAQLSQQLRNVRIVLFSKNSITRYVLSHPGLWPGALVHPAGSKQYLLRKARSGLINRYKPDIIHFEFSGIGIEYLNEFRYLKAKTVVSCRGSAEKVKLLMSADRREKFARLMQVVDAVHCVSDDMRATNASYCPPEKIFINHPSINSSFFRRSRPVAAGKKNVILSIGRLTFQKGHAAGLMAMKKLKEAGLPFHWVIMGDGNKYEEIVFKTRQLGLQNEVKLVGSGSREEVKHLMEESSVFFLPSVYEGIANVVLEAMSLELPVVSSRCGGMEEVITDGQDGLLADVYDPGEMAEQLMRLLTDEELYKRIAGNCRATIEKRFSIDRQLTVFENKYLELCGLKKAGGVS